MFCIASRDNLSLLKAGILTGALGFVRRATRLVLPTPESLSGNEVRYIPRDQKGQGGLTQQVEYLPPSMTILYRGGLAVVDVALLDMVALR